MTIDCKSFEMFMEVINELVKKGLTFAANADTLCITLTGGY